MSAPLKLLEATRLNDSAIIVTFSDGTATTFTAEELASLRSRNAQKVSLDDDVSDEAPPLQRISDLEK